MTRFPTALCVTTLLLAGCGAAASAPLSATPPTLMAVMATNQADVFPGLGHVVRVDFGSRWDLHFASLTQMTYTPPGQPVENGETVKIAVTPIRAGVFMVTWQEGDGTSVVHIEDYSNGVLYTNITTPDGKFYNLKGTLEIVG